MRKENNLGFPFSYGDIPSNEGNRVSDVVSEQFVVIVTSKKFKNICSAFLSLAIACGSRLQVANAIPPEAGEHIAKAADAAVNAGEAATLTAETTGRVAAGVANKAAPVGIAGAQKPVLNMPITAGMPGSPGGPGMPPIYMPLGRPVTPGSRIANTVFYGGSLLCICVNAYWGNPVAIAGCSVMVLTWFGTILGVNFGK